ncbi:MAG TPA: hypothetical protein VFV66_30700 [Nonomuraea sp.]|nr:hypothetical protein [Nonomuraea sp.]
MTTQVVARKIATWTVAIVSGAIVWTAGGAALGAVGSASASTVAVAEECGNTWPCTVAEDGNRPVAAADGDGVTLPLATRADCGNTWPC